MYEDVDECVEAEKFMYNIFAITTLVVFLVLRIYFTC